MFALASVAGKVRPACKRLRASIKTALDALRWPPLAACTRSSWRAGQKNPAFILTPLQASGAGHLANAIAANQLPAGSTDKKAARRIRTGAGYQANAIDDGQLEEGSTDVAAARRIRTGNAVLQLAIDDGQLQKPASEMFLRSAQASVRAELC